MDRKLEFVRLALVEGANRRELCRRFGVSPSLGYRLLRRYLAQGEAGLSERSRRPLNSPRRTDAATEAQVVELRAAHPAWGGRKISKVLQRQGLAAPAASTVTDILRREGIELGGHGGGAARFVRFEHPAPNDLWQMDFKGHVALRSGWLHPLTVLDDHSRFNLVLAACADQKTATVQRHLIEAFERYGQPWKMMTDNGSPWGNGPGDPYTPLGVWLMEHDIGLGHSRPYHPQTLGKDERFHRTLKAEALAGPPMIDLDQAARRLRDWRDVYNLERPHEALDLEPPIARYQTSPRRYQPRIAPFDHGPDAHLRKVQQKGFFSFRGRELKVPKAFAGKQIAIIPTLEDGHFEIRFRHHLIKAIDLRR
jgi:transposase InsO family protein